MNNLKNYLILGLILAIVVVFVEMFLSMTGCDPSPAGHLIWICLGIGIFVLSVGL